MPAAARFRGASSDASPGCDGLRRYLREPLRRARHDVRGRPGALRQLLRPPVSRAWDSADARMRIRRLSTEALAI